MSRSPVKIHVTPNLVAPAPALTSLVDYSELLLVFLPSFLLSINSCYIRRATLVLLFLDYGRGDTERRSLCSKNFKNQATERVTARYYRKRGSASYIVREVRSVRERERYRESETEVTSP